MRRSSRQTRLLSVIRRKEGAVWLTITSHHSHCSTAPKHLARWDTSLSNAEFASCVLLTFYCVVTRLSRFSELVSFVVFVPFISNGAASWEINGICSMLVTTCAWNVSGGLENTCEVPSAIFCVRIQSALSWQLSNMHRFILRV